MGDLESQYGQYGVETDKMRRESLHRVYRYLFPWLPIDMIEIDYARKMEQGRKRLCSVHGGNWRIQCCCSMMLGDEYSM